MTMRNDDDRIDPPAAEFLTDELERKETRANGAWLLQLALLILTIIALIVVVLTEWSRPRLFPSGGHYQPPSVRSP
jgi:hypothetical protein